MIDIGELIKYVLVFLFCMVLCACFYFVGNHFYNKYNQDDNYLIIQNETNGIDWEGLYNNLSLEFNYTLESYKPVCEECFTCKPCQTIRDLEPDQDRLISLITSLKICERQKQTCYNSNMSKNVTRLLDELNNCELILNKTRTALE